ncbi:hypothetical protein LMG29542_06588 [Paraburkholderia humisilvae]|uniref:Uncharacterized protein n=1 Tax=Paraburkholderia humisilvae TaxID=627669 RepID=A0A6J5F1B8_9BURK|nr:hypothetical protein LMG29542_06588 [Paraburkholderia humisilvae]
MAAFGAFPLTCDEADYCVDRGNPWSATSLPAFPNHWISHGRKKR